MTASTEATNGRSVDHEAVTATQQATWSKGDFHEIARQNVGMAEALCTAVDRHAGQRVLDVACGSGAAALVAARRYCAVTGIDYVPSLIERARQRAHAEAYTVDFRVRVCRPGGRIGLASPMPAGWSGDWFGAHSQYGPPPPGLHSPLRWGTEEGVSRLLGEGACSIESRPGTALQYFRSVGHAVEVFTTYFGPTIRTLGLLDKDTQQQFRNDLEAVFTRHNRATDGTAIIENTYLQTIAVLA